MVALTLIAEASLILQCVATLLGVLVAGGFFLGMHYRVSWRWRRLASVYGAEQAIQVRSIRRMQSVILFGGAAFQSCKGVVNVAVSDEGIALSIMPPFHLFYFCRPLFIPHEEITSLPTEWYLNSVSYKWTVRREPNIEIVVDQDLAKWIDGVVNGRPELEIDPQILAGN